MHPRLTSVPESPPLRWFRRSAVPLPTETPPVLRGAPAGARGGMVGRVVLAGAGAVGGGLAATCVRLGASVIGIDPDEFGGESWRTQWCRAGDAGRSKAERLAETLHAINPSAAVAAGRGWIQDVPWQVLHRADVLVSAGDNLAMLVFLGRMAAALGKPLVQGAVHGETWSAIARVWDLRDAAAACPACHVSAAEWSRMQVRRGCDVRELHPRGEAPTQTLPFVCGAAGQMAAAEVCRVLWGREAKDLAYEMLFCLLSGQVYRTRLERRDACRCLHRRYEVEQLSRSPDQLQLADVLRTSGRGDRPGVEVSSERPWCSWTLCGECHRAVAIRRFVDLHEPVGECRCGAALWPQTAGLRRVAPQADLKQCAGRTLLELGLPSGRGIVVDDGEAPPWCGFLGPLADLAGSLDGAPAPAADGGPTPDSDVIPR